MDCLSARLVVVVALALVHLAAAIIVPEKLIAEVRIQNNFPADNITIQCDSNFMKNATVHLVNPGRVYNFSFNSFVQHDWWCFIATEKLKGNPCNKTIYRGKFTIWNVDLPAFSHWFVDENGLSLIRHRKTKPVLVYKWPKHIEDKNC